MGMMLHRHYQEKAEKTPVKEPKVTEKGDTTQPKKRSAKKPAEK